MFELPPIWESTERWIRVRFDGRTIVDSRRAMLMLENHLEMDYYFPWEDVSEGLLRPSDFKEHTAARGTRRFWHVATDGKTTENAAWTYEPKRGRPDFSGYVALVWSEMDHWYEENEAVFLEPRNPYHRVDFIPSERHVRVVVDGVVVADSRRPMLVYETYTPIRFYIPPEDVDARYLEPTDLRTRCQYKGQANYYTLNVNGESYANAAWYYPEPLPESARVRDKVAFWPEKDPRVEIVVDGKPYLRRRSSTD